MMVGVDRDDTASAQVQARPEPQPVSWQSAGLGALVAAMLPVSCAWLIGAEGPWLLFWLPATATLVTWFRSRYRRRWPAVLVGLGLLAGVSFVVWVVLARLVPDTWSLALAASVGAVAGCFSFAAV